MTNALHKHHVFHEIHPCCNVFCLSLVKTSLKIRGLVISPTNSQANGFMMLHVLVNKPENLSLPFEQVFFRCISLVLSRAPHENDGFICKVKHDNELSTFLLVLGFPLCVVKYIDVK